MIQFQAYLLDSCNLGPSNSPDYGHDVPGTLLFSALFAPTFELQPLKLSPGSQTAQQHSLISQEGGII